MKHFSKFLLLAAGAISLSSCDFLAGLIGGKGYDSYEEYFLKEKKYEKFTDIDSFNNKLDEANYFWQIYDGSSSISYYSGKSNLYSVYKDKDEVYFYSTQGDSVDIEKKDGVVTFETKEVVINDKGEKTVKYIGKDNALNVAVDDGGYLVVAYEKYMFYVTKDLKTVYENESNTKVFQGYTDTKTVPDSALLTNTLTALGEDVRMKLPSPGKDVEIWYGLETYKEKTSNGSAYIAGVSALDYVKTLEENGFTVNRSYEDCYYAFYGKDGGFWYCFDEKQEIELIISLEHYLYTSDLGKTYGPFLNTHVRFYKMRKGYFGEKNKTTETERTSYDKSRFAEWYDGTIDANAIPFIQLGKNYSIPTSMSYAHEGILDGTLAYHHKCYNITDDCPYYLLDGYDQILENNGFHKYVPKYDLDNSQEKSDFFNTEDCKYVECFLNKEKDMAIKYYFDVNQGNTIRVFKMSEMKSWLTDSED